QSVEIFFEFIRWPAYRCGAGDSRHAARASFDHLVGVGKERICANDPTASVCQRVTRATIERDLSLRGKPRWTPQTLGTVNSAAGNPSGRPVIISIGKMRS